MRWKVTSILGVGCFLALVLILVACAPTAGPVPTPCPQCPDCPECPSPQSAACPTQVVCPECPSAAVCPEVTAATGAEGSPFQSEWAGSGHADAAAQAFSHWNEQDPPEIPPECATCHSEPGYLDYLGADGSAAGVVDRAAPTGTVVTCNACHSQPAIALDTVTFPSGISLTVEGPAARCVVCHQGRASKKSLDDAVAAAGLTDDDTVSADLGFTNIHYFAAAASMYGTLVKGGYEYEGKRYDGKFDHVAGLDGCAQCHDPHTLELRLEQCSQCHPNLAGGDDPKNIRMTGSLIDYDGDGNREEGIYYEIEGLQEMLYTAMRKYATEVTQTPIAYDSAAYPYFFVDTDANGAADEGEAVSANAYNAWTGRLAKAAYNYQLSKKDPGGYAHGGKYIIQLLYDSVENLNEALSTPVDLSAVNRIDDGHFAGSEEAFRHWDGEGVVPGLCARCHTAEGLPFYLKEGVNASEAPSNGLNCATCHDDLTRWSIYPVSWVRFPRGTLIDSGDPRSNLCLNCHQGLSSIATINGATAGLDLDTVAPDLEFVNIHYFAAAATLYGSEVQGAYEYANDQGYARRLTHVEGFQSCAECHDIHRQDVKVEACAACHSGVSSPRDLPGIRMDPVDYDGDGNVQEGIAGEIETMREALYTALQRYAAETAGTPIVFEPQVYPYFFTDTDADGEADPEEAVFANRYTGWTPRLLRAAYNFQYAVNDPGAFAHNPTYVLQILYDTLVDMGGVVSEMVRP